MLPPHVRVLLVEDNPGDARLIREMLAEADGPACDVQWADSLAEAARRLATGRVEIVLLDLGLPDSAGLDSLRALTGAVGAAPVVIVMSGWSDEDVAVQAVQEGAQDYLVKGRFDGHLLRRSMRYALERAEVQQALQRARTSLEQQVVERTARLAEAVTALQQELTERRRAESALRQSEAVLRATLESSQDGVLVVASDRSVSHSNDRFRQIWAIPDNLLASGDEGALIERMAPQCSEPEDFRTGVDALHRSAARSEDSISLRDGRTLERWSAPLLCEGEQRGRVWFFRDVTERKRLEARFLTAQRTEAMGQLASGIAHDFNNILTVILGGVDSAVERLAPVLPQGDPTLDCLQQIEQSAQRAAALTRQVLAFSRRQVVRPQVVNLDDLLTDMEKMLRRLLTENIALRLVSSGPRWQVRIDPCQFEQVVMNLVVNARDAMPDGGVLTLETGHALLDHNDVQPYPDARPGPHVALRVCDTGCGMTADLVERVFEPFFTTKEPGRGTGLGLATVSAIVRQAGGHISVRTEPGRGSTFQVSFPAIVEQTPTRRRATPADVAPRGAETILLCEDDPALRRIATLMLESGGYTVLAAEDGERARRLSEQHRDGIHLLVTDVILPDTTGNKLAERLVAARPDIRVLFVSGYASTVIGQHGVIGDAIEFLEKPFTRVSLLTRVREVLDR